MVPQLATAESLLGTSSKPTIPEKNTERIWVCLKIWYPIHRSSPKTSPGSSSLRIQEPPNLLFWSIVAAALLSLVGVVAYLFISRSAAAAATAPAPPSRALKWKVLQDLAKAQAPVLLQLCQPLGEADDLEMDQHLWSLQLGDDSDDDP